MLTRFSAFLFVLCIVNGVQSAPDYVSPGSSLVDGSILQPYKNLWRFTLKKAGQKEVEIGTWSDEL